MCRLAISIFSRIDEKNTPAHSCEAAQGRETSWTAADNDDIVVCWLKVGGRCEGVSQREEPQEADEEEQHRVQRWWMVK